MRMARRAATMPKKDGRCRCRYGSRNDTQDVDISPSLVPMPDNSAPKSGRRLIRAYLRSCFAMPEFNSVRLRTMIYFMRRRPATLCGYACLRIDGLSILAMLRITASFIGP